MHVGVGSGSNERVTTCGYKLSSHFNSLWSLSLALSASQEAKKVRLSSYEVHLAIDNMIEVLLHVCL